MGTRKPSSFSLARREAGARIIALAFWVLVGSSSMSQGMSLFIYVSTTSIHHALGSVGAKSKPDIGSDTAQSQPRRLPSQDA